jgi:hypothetical protein
MITRCLTTLLACAILSGCGWLKGKPKVEPTASIAPKTPQRIGQIASIGEGKKFVLIYSPEKWSFPPGTVLTTRGDLERTANLLFTGEMMGNYVAADIQAGEVAVGDAVYSPIPETPAASPAPADTQAPTASPAPAATPALPRAAEVPDHQ